jgi:hypothetical protein
MRDRIRHAGDADRDPSFARPALPRTPCSRTGDLALRQQLAALTRTRKRSQVRTNDRLFWVCLASAWRGWRTALGVVHPDTVVRWHRQWLRRQWPRRSARGRSGRPSTTAAIRALVMKIAAANPLWGAPRIDGELGKLGVELSERTISRLGERHLRRVLTGYCAYYHGSRTHLSLAKDAPTPRRVQGLTEGDVIAFREVGGLHHRYERRAA